MRCPDLPVVVVSLQSQPVPRAARLADVLIVQAEQEGGTELTSTLLTQYPGLALVVAGTPAGKIVIGARDGTTVTLRPARVSGRPSVVLLTGVAYLLYTCWVTGWGLNRWAGRGPLLSPGAVQLINLPHQFLSPRRPDGIEDREGLLIMLPCGVIGTTPSGDVPEQVERLCSFIVRTEFSHAARGLGRCPLRGAGVPDAEIGTGQTDQDTCPVVRVYIGEIGEYPSGFDQQR
jgi:hypothetical protein